VFNFKGNKTIKGWLTLGEKGDPQRFTYKIQGGKTRAPRLRYSFSPMPFFIVAFERKIF